MKIIVWAGEELKIGFADEKGMPIDGEFTVFFDTKEFPKRLVIQETAGLPGNIKGRAEEVLYEEDFDPDEEEDFDPNDPINQLALTYSIVLHWDNADNKFIAKCVEMPSCVAIHSDRNKAIASVYKMIEESLSFMEEKGIEPPKIKGGNE